MLRVPWHLGYFEQPQNRNPALFPFRAVGLRMDAPHNGHRGVPTAASSAASFLASSACARSLRVVCSEGPLCALSRHFFIGLSFQKAYFIGPMRMACLRPKPIEIGCHRLPSEQKLEEVGRVFAEFQGRLQPLLRLAPSAGSTASELRAAHFGL